MSVSVDTSEDSTDYGSFEYQQVDVTANQVPNGDDAQSGHSVSVEPLSQIGGLDNNEVAELVYMEVQARIITDDANADQNVGTQAYMNGLVGANVDESNYSLETLGAPEAGTAEDLNSIQQSNTEFVSTSRDEVFQLFQAEHSVPFDDETNGLGGGAASQSNVYEKNWRSLTARGPVLDSNDDISINLILFQEDSILLAEGQVTVHMVWDVSQTDDAGRAFSVPE